MNKKFSALLLVALFGIFSASPSHAIEVIVLLTKTTQKGMIRHQAIQVLNSLKSQSKGQEARLDGIYEGAYAAAFDVTPEQRALLAANPQVRAVVPNFEIRLPRFNPRVIDPSELKSRGDVATYGLINTGVMKLRAEHPEIDGRGVVVGILDTGIDAAHADLQGKVLAFRDFVGQQTTPYDDHGHGSHVAGTISGSSASGTAIGVAPGVKLVIGKVFTSSGGGTLKGIMDSMQWMLDMKTQGKFPITVVSNSWGMGQRTQDIQNEPMADMVNSWIKAGIVPVFAAGNSGPSPQTVSVPGAVPTVVTVAAVDKANQVASFSSRGPVRWTINGTSQTFAKPDIAAPGVAVISSLPGGKYGSMSGTSMATPHVAGIMALFLQQRPDLPPSQASKILCGAAYKFGRTQLEPNYSIGCGVIQARLLTQNGKRFPRTR